jgi:hypothetical protein
MNDTDPLSHPTIPIFGRRRVVCTLLLPPVHLVSVTVWSTWALPRCALIASDLRFV